MADHKVGYCRPPRDRQFKPGESGNSKGRPKRKLTPLAECVNHIFEEPTKYRERGQKKRATWHELTCRSLIERAVAGDIDAADDILKIVQRAQRRGEGGIRLIKIRNWLPDRPGQTAEEKTKAVQSGRHAEPANHNSEE